MSTIHSDRWRSIAVALVAGTLIYNLAEGIIATTFGAVAESIALFGFGLDSFIELAASGILLWRLRVEVAGADPERIEILERRAERFVGGTFFALAGYVLIEAGLTLALVERPAISIVGIVLAALSLVVMPLTALAKLRAARAIGSAALRAEAKETLACAYLSATLLVGLAANAAWGWWWADPLAALIMVPWLLKEGREAWQGEEEDEED